MRLKFCLLFIILMGFSGNLFAQEVNSLFGINFKEVLGDYPKTGSIEERKDVDVLLHFQTSRTKEECDQAQSEVKASLENFFSGKKGPLTLEEVKSVKNHFAKALIYAGTEIEMAKLYYHRPRPYDIHADLFPCISKENSKSYPSGHATLARLYAQLLSKYFPERKDEIFKRANEIALNRIIGGVHNPSDIEAGKKLGDVLAEKILNDD